MKKFITVLLLLGLVALFVTCDKDDNTHTHEWGAWQYNETEHWKECTANDGAKTAEGNHTGDPCTDCGYATPQPIDKTFPITLKDGALVFTVAYKALPADAEPAYLAYIKERLELMSTSTAALNVASIDALLLKGNSFTITIKYGGTSFNGMNWNTAEQSFVIHNDWITTAEGTTGNNALSFVMCRDAFETVEIE
jgi:hypothetical protein